jgi:hypothetical protein
MSDAKRARAAAEPVSAQWQIHMPEVLWGLVAQMMPLSSAVALATACRATFSAVCGLHGHTTSVDKVVPFSSLQLHCAVRVSHVSIASLHELQALVRSG